MSQHCGAALGDGRSCRSRVSTSLEAHGKDLSAVELQVRAEFVSWLKEPHPGDALQFLYLTGLFLGHTHLERKLRNVVQDFCSCLKRLLFPGFLYGATKLYDVITWHPLLISVDGQARRDRWFLSAGRCKLNIAESDQGSMLLSRRADLNKTRHR